MDSERPALAFASWINPRGGSLISPGLAHGCSLFGGERQSKDPQGREDREILDFYKKLGAIRAQYDVFADGDFAIE